MACEAVLACTIGAAATAYVFPTESVTELIVAAESFQLTITTVKFTPLLDCAPTVTTTLPVAAPAGTGTVMLVALHAVGVAGVPLKVTVLVPWEAPKFAPPIIMEAPTGPEAG